MAEQILYTRASDGCNPVHLVLDPSLETSAYQLHLPDKIETYDNARQLLIAVTGHPEARHWTLERYFKLGRFAPASRDQGSPILDAFGPGGWASPIGNQLVTTVGMIGVRPSGLGIDLEARGHEVAKLLYAGFNGMMRAAHYDSSDVLQEVYKGILIRNMGKCPFDATKASFGHYVHMVCRCILSNYHRRTQRYREPLSNGLPGGSAGSPLTFGEGEDKSPALAFVPNPQEIRVLRDAILAAPGHPQKAVALRMVPYLLRYDEGDALWNTATIAGELGVSKAVAAKALTFVRHSLRRVAH